MLQLIMRELTDTETRVECLTSHITYVNNQIRVTLRLPQSTGAINQHHKGLLNVLSRFSQLSKSKQTFSSTILVGHFRTALSPPAKCRSQPHMFLSLHYSQYIVCRNDQYWKAERIWELTSLIRRPLPDFIAAVEFDLYSCKIKSGSGLWTRLRITLTHHV